MATLIETTEAFFKSAGWPAQRAANQPIVRTKYSAGGAEWFVYAVADEAHHHLVVFSVHPEQVPAERRAAIAELFMGINFELPIGNLELDFRDGTMRLRTSFDFDGIEPTELMIRNLVITNVAAMGRFLEPIGAALTKGSRGGE